MECAEPVNWIPVTDSSSDWNMIATISHSTEYCTEKNTNNDCKVICYFSHQWLSPLPLQCMSDNAFNTIDLETKSKGPRVSGASRAWSRWSSPPQCPCPPFVGAPPTARRSPFQPTASPPQIPERIFYFWKLHSTMTGHTDKKCYGESSKKTVILRLGWP